jgi:hypothetical protein
LDHGDMKSTYGTGAFLLANLGTKPVMSEHGLITTAWLGTAHEFGRTGARCRRLAHRCGTNAGPGRQNRMTN